MRGCQEMELALKREMDDYYLFLVEVVDGQVRILRDQSLPSMGNSRKLFDTYKWMDKRSTESNTFG